MALGKQAKIISDKQVRAVLAELDTRRYPFRDRVMFLLSIKAGMRAKEIASVTWAMLTDAEGEIGIAYDRFLGRHHDTGLPDDAARRPATAAMHGDD